MKPYKKLRVKLMEQDNDIKDLAPLLNRSIYYINGAINAHDGKFFKEDEIYKIMKFIGEPEQAIGEYFNTNQRKGS